MRFNLPAHNRVQRSESRCFGCTTRSFGRCRVQNSRFQALLGAKPAISDVGGCKSWNLVRPMLQIATFAPGLGRLRRFGETFSQEEELGCKSRNLEHRLLQIAGLAPGRGADCGFCTWARRESRTQHPGMVRIAGSAPGTRAIGGSGADKRTVGARHLLQQHGDAGGG